MKWVTREHPKIDRVACPWLIRRFIDRDAEFLFVAPAEGKQVVVYPDAYKTGDVITPFDKARKAK